MPPPVLPDPLEQPPGVSPLKRFPIISLAILATLFIALQAVAHLSRSYCAGFGFGGFGCIAPFVGWGEVFIGAMIVLVLANIVQALVVIVLLVRWWMARRSAPNEAPRT